MGIGKKITKGMIGGGVNIAHKSKMSQTAANQMSFPGGTLGPGQYGSSDNSVVGKGMTRYIAGENVSIGMKKGKAHENMPYKLGDLSVEAGIDKNPDVTRADIITGAKKNKSGGTNKFGGPAKEPKAVKSVNEIDGKKDNYSYQKPIKTETLKEVKKPREASKEIGKSKIEAGKKLKKEGRQEKRAARKDARKSKRSDRLDKKIALQEFKGKQKLKSGDKLGAKAKQDRIKNLKARKAKK